MKDKNIVIFGLQPWDISIGSNCKNIALELAKYNNVLYVNRPLDRINWLRAPQTKIVKNRLAVLQGKEAPIKQLAARLWVLTPAIVVESIQWLKPYGLFAQLNKWNNRKIAQSILEYTEKLGFDEFILFNDSAMFQGMYLKEFLQPSLSIYYIRDYLIAQPYFKKHGAKAEKALVKQADVVVANSTYLTNYAKRYNQNSFYIGQGCDLSLFQPSTDYHPLLKDIPRPIVGYVGMLSAQRLDLELLAYMATQRPDWSIVLVGGEDETFRNSALHDYSNIHFLGLQPPATLASFVNGFDVCINPQVVNQLSIGNYPRKIDEYLAMGKPVVATATDAMTVFEAYVSLASNHRQFVRHIAHHLEQPIANSAAIEQRITFARSHTWEQSVSDLWTAVAFQQTA